MSMLDIQISSLRSYGSFQLAAIQRFCEDISRTLLLGDYNKMQDLREELLGLMAKGGQFKGFKLSQFYCMLGIMVFNLSLCLEKTKAVFQNSLIESTGVEEFDQNKVIRKSEEIDDQVGLFMKQVLLSKELETLLLSMRETKASKSLELSALIQAVEFLTAKYQVASPLMTVTKPKVLHLLLESPFSVSQAVVMNNTLFNQGSKGAITMIQTHHQSAHVMLSLCAVLYANDSKRPLFAKTPPSRQILTSILEFVVSSCKPHLIFSQGHFAVQPLCSFLTTYMLFEFGHCHAKFMKIINKFVVVEDLHQYYNRQASLFEEVNELLESFIPSRFGNFLSLVFKALCGRHTKDESIEIMKLLVFNRFLLSPEIKCNLDSLSQDFSLHSNRVRNIFFPTKLKHVQSILPISMQCFNTFTILCQSNDKSKDPKTLFITDKALQIFYKHIQEAVLKQQRPQIRSALQTPMSSKTQTPLPINNTSITKNLLQDLSKSSFNHSHLELASTDIMGYLSQYRLEYNHQLNQRQRYWESNRNMDAEFNQRFFAVSDEFNEKKQGVLAAKRLCRINSLLPL